ncbi:MAG: PmbA protein [Myxococcota bacterium]
MSALVDLAAQAVERALALGAEEAQARASSGSHVQITRRGGRVEQATEATTRGLVVSVLAEGRFTSNSTSDLRPEALEAFLRRCVDSAGYIEPDPDRALPPGDECGRGVSAEQLDQDDPAWAERTAADRSSEAEALEAAMTARADASTISASVWVADGRSTSARVMSNGFADEDAGAWFVAGADCTLRDGDKRPESGASYAARHLADLPSAHAIAAEADQRARERIGAGPIDSGSYPLILSNRAVGRILGALTAPLSGASLHQRRSCLADKLGERIGSDVLTLIDDPTVPRGLASQPWDGDGRVARRSTVIEAGVLQRYYIGTYYSRKLSLPATSSGRSNWVVSPGDRPWSELAAGWPKAILVTGFLGGNSNAASGDFSFGIRGTLVENGSLTAPLGEMNVSGNLLDLLQRLVAVGDDPWAWSSVVAPTMLFDGVSFSGT